MVIKRIKEYIESTKTNMKYLYDSLLEYQQTNAYPFHMPGHKRRGCEFVNPFLIDITEIDQFDNLHHAEGILKEAQERAGKLYGSEETHFLVNGSTCGILSAISACTNKGGKILMARNCHKAAYHGALLGDLEIVYVYPCPERHFGINGGIDPEQVRECLEEDREIQAVLVTSPTFDGVVSDVGEIARIAHVRGVPLIVDEAHGAHFGFHPYFPVSSVEQGADLVIHSLHKTLPSFTQTALLHVNGRLVDRKKLDLYLGIYQTSSPSYVLMAGMDECMRRIDREGKQLFSEFAKRLDLFYERVLQLKRIKVAGKWLIGEAQINDFDPSKLILSACQLGMDGNMLQQRLRRDYHLELEMAAGGYALALTSVMDSEEGLNRLWQALLDLDRGPGGQSSQRGDMGVTADAKSVWDDTVASNTCVCRISQALEAEKERIPLKESAGRISGEFLYLYPPGIPLLVPGERIETQLIERIEQYKSRGFAVQGPEDYTSTYIMILG